MQTTIDWNGQPINLEYDEVAPSIYVYRNVIPKEWNLVERIENALAMPGTRFAWEPAGLGYGEVDHQHRKCVDFKVDEDILLPRDQYSEDMLDVYDKLITSLKQCMSHYITENYIGQIEYYEVINIVRYGKGEFFNVHTDDGDPYRCTVSAVGYPNDDYQGGELWFPKFDLNYKPTAGDWVLFPSAYSYAHSSEPVTDDGVKYSFVTMTDRSTFAHRHDSPIHNSEDERRAHGVL